MLPLLLAPVLSKLAESGLNLVADAITAKGKDVVENTLGIKIPDQAEELTPELLLNLRLAQIEQNTKLQELAVKQDELYLADVANARAMNLAALASEDIFVRRFTYYLTAFIYVCSFVYIGFVTFGHIPADNIPHAHTILGFLLGTLMSQTLGFFFGTTRANRDKDDTLKKLTEVVHAKGV